MLLMNKILKLISVSVNKQIPQIFEYLIKL